MRLIIILLCLVPSFVFANDNQLEMRYASSSWNTNSKKIDSAFMFLRDKTTGRLAKIQLEETEPDSSLFSGQFSLNWTSEQNTQQNIEPEVFVPPQQMRNDSRATEKFNALLNKSEIHPQPYFSHNENGKKIFEVYDTLDQATRAKDAYHREEEAAAKAKLAQLIKPLPNESSINVAKMAEHTAEMATLAQQATQRELGRLRLEQIEEQQRQEKIKEQEQLSAQEKLKRQNQAAELVRKANIFYQNSEYKKAEKLFSEAVKLQPDNHEYYFQYGVSQFRVEKFDDALVTLKLADVTGQQDLEKKYYMGLIHYKLKEITPAKQFFAEVKKANDQKLSSPAGFYLGLTQFSNEEFVPAQASFEYVVDNADDPELAKKAEDYLEKIARQLEFKKIAAKKFMANLNLGLIYDSNILLSPDNDTSTSTASFNKGGGRVSVGGDLEYRFFFKEKKDFSTKFAFNDTQSFSTDFASADPATFTLTAPYNIKGIRKNRGYKLGLAPGFETYYMDYNATGNSNPLNTKLLNTVMLNTDLMLVMRDNWFSSYNLDIRHDDSLIVGSANTGDNDADALKVGLTKSESFFLDKAKKRALVGSAGYTINNAKGKEKKYDRISLSAFYTAPYHLKNYQNLSWHGSLGAYFQNYADSSSGRKDQNISLSLGLNKVFSEAWSWSNDISYISNGSNISSYAYNKYMISTTMNYSWGK